MTVGNEDRKAQIRRYLQHLQYPIAEADYEAFVDHIDELMQQNGWRVEMAFRTAAGDSVPAEPALSDADKRLRRRVVIQLATSKLGSGNEAVIDEVFHRAKELGGTREAIVQAVTEIEDRWAQNVAGLEEIEPASDERILRFVFRDAGEGDVPETHTFRITPGDTDEALRAIIDQAIKQTGVDLPESGRRLLEEMLMGRAHRRSVSRAEGDDSELTLTPHRQSLRERLTTEAFAAGVTLAMVTAKVYRRAAPAINRFKALAVNTIFDENPHDALVVVDYALRFSSVAYLIIYFSERRQPGAYWNLIAAVGTSLAARQARRMAQVANAEYGKEEI